MLELIRQIVREEITLLRGPLLGTVSVVYAHEAESDTANYEADVRLKHDGLELQKVPIAVTHAGLAAPPRIGDLVLVQFLDHDLQQPLVTGRFYHEDDRPPLHKEDEVLFEQRVADGTLNHLRFANDGSIYLQRDVTAPEDNTAFTGGIKIDPSGVIELKMGDKVVVTLQDGAIDILSDGSPITITCDELTVDGKLKVTKDVAMDAKLTVTGDAKLSGVKISGTEITGG
jgi:hypothetical protein